MSTVYFSIAGENRHGIIHATKNSAGYDLSCVDEVIIPPHSLQLVGTGVAITGIEQSPFESDFAVILCPRSSISRYGLLLANSPGIVDMDYRGEIKVLLYNMTNAEIYLAPNTRIVQMCFVSLANVEIPSVYFKWTEGEERGVGGFGSTGDKDDL